MKHLLLTALALTSIVFTACEKEKNDKGRLDPSAKVAINAPAGSTKGSDQRLSPQDIVRKATSIRATFVRFGEVLLSARGFNKSQKDTVNWKLLMYGTDVIDMNGNIPDGFVSSWDVIIVINDQFTQIPIDTIAYVPNAIMRDAEVKIRRAHADSNYVECYKVFDKAFTFQPITGEEWRALKAKGEN